MQNKTKKLPKAITQTNFRSGICYILSWYTIKNKVERELSAFIHNLDKAYSLSKTSPLLFRNIKDFVSRKGKRLRPVLFVTAYLGFAKKIAPHLYKTAISFELLHDFLLVHDDIIDKSAIRRGKPAMHKMFDNYLRRFKKVKFNGQDLAILTGDVLFTLAMETFLSIKEKRQRKEKALSRFIKAAIYTGTGEFIELLSGVKGIERITREDIYRIYDLKTACYTFASPLSCGAILAGAGDNQANRLYQYGLYLGRAFQIKDDILGMFSQQKETGKSALSDLQEGKKTLLLWYAYRNSAQADKLLIKKTLSKDRINKSDLFKMRKIISKSGALACAGNEVSRLLKNAKDIIKSSRMRREYKKLLNNYTEELLTL